VEVDLQHDRQRVASQPSLRDSIGALLNYGRVIAETPAATAASTRGSSHSRVTVGVAVHLLCAGKRIARRSAERTVCRTTESQRALAPRAQQADLRINTHVHQLSLDLAAVSRSHRAVAAP
jgi:hypothetical protein